MAKQKRDYQIETEDKVFESVENGLRSMIICLATGLGKTYIGSNIVKKVNQKGSRVLWLTHNIELIEQSSLALYLELTDRHENLPIITELGGMLETLNHVHKNGIFSEIADANEFRRTIGIIKESRMDIHADVCVASIQTLYRRLNRIDPNHFDYIIVDECHYAMAKTWKDTLDHFSSAIRIGLTATPERLDGASLGDLFEDIIVDFDLKYGIDNGYLVEISGQRIKTEIDISKVGSSMGDFNKADLEKVINTKARNKQIVDKIIEYAPGKQSIAFCIDVQHAIDLSNMANRFGLRSAFIVGDEKLISREQRKKIWNDFKQYEYDLLTNVTILTTGADHDMVECIVNARPTQSKTIFLQGIGRGTRPQKGVIDGLETKEERILAIRNSDKPLLTVLDIVENTTRHNLINCWTLDNKKRVEDKVFITGEKRLKLLEERSKSQKKLEHTLKEDVKVELMRLPEIVIYKRGKYLEPATAEQLAVLKKMNYDVDNQLYTKYDVAEIFAKFPAHAWQISKLRDMGYDVSGNVSQGEYSEAMKRHHEKVKNGNLLVYNLATLPFKNIR